MYLYMMYVYIYVYIYIHLHVHHVYDVVIHILPISYFVVLIYVESYMVLKTSTLFFKTVISEDTPHTQRWDNPITDLH